MSGFQFTPGGIVPLGAPVPAMTEDAAGGFVPASAERPAERDVSAPAAARHAAVVAPSDQPLTGKQILALAKARMRVIAKTLAAVPALERERESLRLLVAAATQQKPRPKKDLQ
jgi:hypothetical protein